MSRNRGVENAAGRATQRRAPAARRAEASPTSSERKRRGAVEGALECNSTCEKKVPCEPTVKKVWNARRVLQRLGNRRAFIELKCSWTWLINIFTCSFLRDALARGSDRCVCNFSRDIKESPPDTAPLSDR